jgi:prevent-host-death family protein
MKRYSIHEAKNQFSKLIQRVLRGEEIIIINRRQAVARLCPIRPSKRSLGFLGSGVRMSSDFDSPLKDFKNYRRR